MRLRFFKLLSDTIGSGILNNLGVNGVHFSFYGQCYETYRTRNLRELSSGNRTVSLTGISNAGGGGGADISFISGGGVGKVSCPVPLYGVLFPWTSTGISQPARMECREQGTKYNE